jgi:hypothetical protein
MARVYLKQLITGLAITLFVFCTISCRALATNGEFLGKTTPPERNILRYVNGAEPESLDPATRDETEPAISAVPLAHGDYLVLSSDHLMQKVDRR